MMISAGLVLFRRKADGVEVLLGHMGGPFWSRKDEGAWSIPKGLLQPNEAPLVAARREFEEEVGPLPEGEPFLLGEVVQKSGKKVMAWALEGDFDLAFFQSNMFSLEWPPKSGRRQQFPELDQVRWMKIEIACLKAVAGQAALFRELELKCA